MATALQNWSYPSPCMCDWPSFPCRGGAASREALRGLSPLTGRAGIPSKAAVKTKRHSTGTRARFPPDTGSTCIARMTEIVGALVRRKRFYELTDQSPRVPSLFVWRLRAKGSFGVSKECHFDWIEVWRIGRADSETVAPTAAMAWRTPSILWVRRLFHDTMSPFAALARAPARHRP